MSYLKRYNIYSGLGKPKLKINRNDIPEYQNYQQQEIVHEDDGPNDRPDYVHDYVPDDDGDVL